jgi:hypothetical protein
MAGLVSPRPHTHTSHVLDCWILDAPSSCPPSASHCLSGSAALPVAQKTKLVVPYLASSKLDAANSKRSERAKRLLFAPRIIYTGQTVPRFPVDKTKAFFLELVYRSLEFAHTVVNDRTKSNQSRPYPPRVAPFLHCPPQRRSCTHAQQRKRVSSFAKRRRHGV